MTNIKATIGEYATGGDRKLKMCAPIAINLNENYPKQNMGYVEGVKDFNVYSFVKASYQKIGDNIFFQIFPIGHIDDNDQSVKDFKLMNDYTSIHQHYKQYPSMTLNPNGNLMTAPVLFDSLAPFLNNGISFSDDASKDKSNTVIMGKEGVASDFINWKVDYGRFDEITANYDPQASALFGAKESGQSGYMSNTKGNMGARKITKTQKKQKTFSYVQGIASKYLGNEYDPSKHTAQQYASKRVYKLSHYGLDNPLSNALKAVTGDEQPEEAFFNDIKKSKPFLFIINFSNNQNVSANVDFGYNRVQINPNQLFLTVSDRSWYDENGVIDKTLAERQGHENRAQCSTRQDKNTMAPFFYRGCNGLYGQRSTMFIVYPTYCGIAIQPGIHLPDNLQSSKQSTALRAVGSVVQLSVSNKRRAPTFQTWLQLQKRKYKVTGGSSGFGNNDGNVFLQPHPSNWNSSDLRLTINNGTANFFYMPLYFVSKCRFRMYFKGIKGGKYDADGTPDSSTYVSKGEMYSKKCKQEAAIQYKSVSKTTESGGNGDPQYKEFAEHTYYGSLIYTTEYGVDPSTGNTSVSKYSSISVPKYSYITAPVTAYRIPPYQNDKSFWDTYSMDGYYLDFKIQLKDSNGEGGEKKPFVRQPLQVLGVLIMQVIQFKNGLLDNENGKFNVSQSTVYKATGDDNGELPITKSEDTNSKSDPSWVQYIQNITTSWSQEGGSGSITLDKYALMGQHALPQQCIGGLNISMQGGNPDIIKCESSTGDQKRNCIFTGFGTKLSASDSFSQDTITITLQGPQRKLTDMKLINPPFWDGDKLETAYQWLGHYCGLNIIMNDDKYFSEKTSFACAAKNAKQYVDQNGEKQDRNESDFPMLPTSSNFKRPAVYIKTGDDSFTVLKDLAAKCNCRFVLQPNGNAYVMTQTKNAVPQMCDETRKGGGTIPKNTFYKADFDQNLVLSYSVQPLLNNLHNYIITASYKSANIGNQSGQSTGSLQSGFKVNKKFRQLTTSPEIPWAKVKAFKHQGFMSQSAVQAQFERDIYMVSCYWLSVKVTIPGNQTIWIYDRIKMFGIDYYVLQVSHNIDLVGKKWTTQLTLSNVLKDQT